MQVGNTNILFIRRNKNTHPSFVGNGWFWYVNEFGIITRKMADKKSYIFIIQGVITVDVTRYPAILLSSAVQFSTIPESLSRKGSILLCPAPHATDHISSDVFLVIHLIISGQNAILNM